MPTQSRRFNPPTFEVKNGLENGAYPFIFAKNAKKRPKNGAFPFTPKNGSRCNQDTCDGKTEHVRSHFPKNVSATYNLGNLN